MEEERTKREEVKERKELKEAKEKEVKEKEKEVKEKEAKKEEKINLIQKYKNSKMNFIKNTRDFLLINNNGNN